MLLLIIAILMIISGLVVVVLPVTKNDSSIHKKLRTGLSVVISIIGFVLIIFASGPSKDARYKYVETISVPLASEAGISYRGFSVISSPGEYVVKLGVYKVDTTWNHLGDTRYDLINIGRK